VIALVALVVIGGATRVMQAGLACPDWPLCYGQWLPGGQLNLQVFLEWFHRLDAFVVGVALLVLAGVSISARHRLPPWLPAIALAALLLVALQGALGALTVTQLLAAPLVTAHLATALALVALLSALSQALLLPRPLPVAEGGRRTLWLPLLLSLALAAVLLQCLLGGALASTWSSERCLAAGDGCAFLLRHRLGARAAALVVLSLVPLSWRLPSGQGWFRRLAVAAAALVALQVGLGVSTLRLALAVPAITIAHQAVGALLVALLAAALGRSLALLASSTPQAPVAPGSIASSPLPEPSHG
jgi:cytochrome c oxidase assembly protein subunit 15